MQLIDVDKSLYKQRLNLITVLLVGALALLSVVLGSVLIAFFGAEQTATGSTGNFHLNVIGVIGAVIICAVALSYLKTTVYFAEVYYVWRMKSLQNRIYRKLKKIKIRANENDIEAIIVLYFYYHSLKQIYSLDNNTLTLPELETKINKLQQKIDSLAMSVDLEDFDVKFVK